ncbi:hypothetical protein [Stenotrophomonas sp. SY1]|uniref:hypothetical protein n=1 Tax=Stenotrophomonas sp. SY1 TaxID=477235 RepID=UPI001E5FAD9B|nr:hypothetical protein [Stenotrophomonas sp. SY1]MCD9087348.1 hypothetical protein [Stenotrophomonas sp. SY1]
MFRQFAAASVGALLLSACSMTLPVRGQIQGSDEQFTGTATGRMDGGGELSIVSNKGATCKGTFVYAERRKGEGVFTCDDGRTGPFQFVSTGTRGTGYGDLGGQRFTFTFGKI